MTPRLPHRRGGSSRLAVLALGAVLAACAPAPVADDTWPGFDPDSRRSMFPDQAALWLHVLSDSRSEPIEMRIEFADDGLFENQLGPRTAIDDQVFVGFLDAGTLTVTLTDSRRSISRRVTLESGAGHGLAFDLRTTSPEPASLVLGLASAGVADGAPTAVLYDLDRALADRRASGADPVGTPLDLELVGERWIARLDALHSGEHALRIEPGGIERIVRLEPGENRIALNLAPPTARLELELVAAGTGAPLRDAVVRWVSTAGEESPPLMIGPRDATVVEGRSQIDLAPGTARLLVAAAGIGTHTRTVEVGPDGAAVRLELGRPQP